MFSKIFNLCNLINNLCITATHIRSSGPKKQKIVNKTKKIIIMSIKIVNNWKAKRAFSNKLWYKRGVMWSYENRRYLQIGVLGFIVLVQWGKMY